LAPGLSESFFPGDFLLGLNPPVGPDVQQADAPLVEHAADQPSPMAVGRVFFSAQQGGAAVGDGLQKPLQTALEGGRAGQAVVADVPLGVVQIGPFRLAAQKIAQEQVIDAAIFKGAADCLAVEMGGVARVGARADVDDQADAVLLDQPEERLQGMVGMPDREEADVPAHVSNAPRWGCLGNWDAEVGPRRHVGNVPHILW